MVRAKNGDAPATTVDDRGIESLRIIPLK